MKARWFGQPWPSEDERAPICDDDACRVDTPVGQRCFNCSDLIVAGERGVVMASAMQNDDWWTMEIVESGDVVRLPVVATHIDCLIRTTVGPDLADTITRMGGIER